MSSAPKLTFSLPLRNLAWGFWEPAFLTRSPSTSDANKQESFGFEASLEAHILPLLWLAQAPHRPYCLKLST